MHDRSNTGVKKIKKINSNKYSYKLYICVCVLEKQYITLTMRLALKSIFLPGNKTNFIYNLVISGIVIIRLQSAFIG